MAGDVGGKRPVGVAQDHVASNTAETEKAKKPRTDKSDVNKSSKNQEQADEKWPASVTNTVPTSTVKKKKKKVEEGNSGKCKPVGFIPLELPTAGSDLKDRLEEVGDVKLKIKSLPPKSNGDKKKDVNATSELSSTASNGKKRKSSTSETKGKKKAKQTKAKTLKDDKQTKKVKIRRGSGDSSTSSSSSLIIGNIGSKSKNLALGALLKEMEVESDGDDGEDDDDRVDILMPFQPDSTPTSETKGSVNGVKSPSNSSPCKRNSKSVPAKVSRGESKNNGYLKKEDALCSTNGKRNGSCLNDVAKPDVLGTSLKPSPSFKDIKASYKEELSVTELLHLHKRLMATRDASCLQRIVDILEATGAYSISEATFDFDLCALDKPTIKKIESCLER